MNAAEKDRRRAAMARDLERRKREEEERQALESELRAWRQAEPSSGVDARRQSMRDAAFNLVREHGNSYPGSALSRRQLAQTFPEVSGDEYAPVYSELLDEGDKLLWAGGEVAGSFREGRMSKLEALRRLKERFPGFSTDTYESAFAFGMFATR